MMIAKDIRQFPRTFWIANSMELFERWAYYGMFAVLSVYLTDPVSTGGLGFTQEQRGEMQGIVTALLYLLPVFSGAVADYLGFRKVLIAAFVTLVSGYFAMGQFHTYGAVFAAFTLVAVGGAMFKPIIVGTVAKTVNRSTETLGFGIFYMIVNIGGFIGPWSASKMRDLSWNYVFYMCSAVILINLILVWFYKEPGRVSDQKKSPLEALKAVVGNTFLVLKDYRFVLFLVIMVGFWATYMQLFFTVPVYITQWVDTSVIYRNLGFLQPVFGSMAEGAGVVRPEMMINIPALTIVLFQVIMSGLLKNVPPVRSMVGGTLVLIIGMTGFGLTFNGFWFALSLVIFAFGEMASSPRIQEYISTIAPADKVALYMGYSFLPVAGGNLLGGILSGKLYSQYADKFLFLSDYRSKMGLSVPDGVTDGAVLFEKTCSELNLEPVQLTSSLAQQYHPGRLWYLFAAMGLATAIILLLYNFFVLKKSGRRE
ncbi:MAG: peptide MFS transporter [Bacteroidales bacterium]